MIIPDPFPVVSAAKDRLQERRANGVGVPTYEVFRETRKFDLERLVVQTATAGECVSFIEVTEYADVQIDERCKPPEDAPTHPSGRRVRHLIGNRDATERP